MPVRRKDFYFHFAPFGFLNIKKLEMMRTKPPTSLTAGTGQCPWRNVPWSDGQELVKVGRSRVRDQSTHTRAPARYLLVVGILLGNTT